MKAICIMNLKGGVGKTVTADNIAAILAAKHCKRVLLIDADHQGNTSTFFQADRTEGLTLREVLLNTAESYWPDVVQRTGYEGLDILPADISLAELDAAPPSGQEVPPVYRLRAFLAAVAEDDAYDYVVIDMPPAFSVAAQAALIAADEVIVPLKLDAFSVDGLAELLRQIAAMRRINPGLRLAGALLTMWRNVPVVTEAEAVLRSGAVPVFATHIRRTDRVDESTFSREPLYIYSPRSAACIDYRRFVIEYLEQERRHSNGQCKV